MFSSFKKAVANSLEQFDELTSINEQKWRQRAQKGVENLKTGVGNIRGSVSQISALVVDNNSRREVTGLVKLPAASDLLLKYENEWIQLHAENVDIAHNANVADGRVTTMLRICEDQKNLLDRFVFQLKLIPQLVESIEKANTQLVEIGKKVAAIEELFDGLESAHEKEEHDRWVVAITADTDTYIANKRRDMKAKEFSIKRQFSDYEKAVAAEKQRQLEIEFEKQLEEYKKEGKPRAVSVSNKSVHEEQEALASVEPEEQPEEKAALTEFLSDVPDTVDEAASSSDALADASTEALPTQIVIVAEETPQEST